ncbi:hypothetical protein AY599_08680 [Leptolyngbya valderiana BDU 20041]|nr:hypothetical protein AY599_08680 [Leptolyngbya valderiana BDU 20041]
MSALPAVRAPAGSGPALQAAAALWPEAQRAWDLTGGVLEGVGPMLAETPPTPRGGAIWPPEDLFAPPVVIVGATSIELIARAITERTGSLQYLPRVMVIEPRAEAALAGLARLGESAARDLLAAPGVEWFVGPAAMERLERWLVEHVDNPLPKSVIDNGAPGGAAAGVARLLAEAHARQQAVMREHGATLRQWANNREKRTAIAERWRTAESLRLLVTTSRYSTYMWPSAADLVEALNSSGHDARLLIEPDDHTRQTQLHYTRAMIDFEPDGVVLLNYLRPHLGPVVPPHVPVVTWSQDAMGHYFMGGQLARSGPRDFVVGMLYPELRDRLGVPEERMLGWLNPVSPTKFHDGAIAGGHEHLRCDVALMTRHSEPPAQYVRRVYDQGGAASAYGRAILELEERVPEALSRSEAQQRWLVHELRVECEAALRASSTRPPAGAMVEGLLQQIAYPLADLHFRQQAARWAASVCGQRGWRLHLYGKGWEDHPELAVHARGELAHGEELRAAYQLASVTIHASVRGQNHQRVAEAAMSGGLPIVRRTFEDLDRARWYQLNAMVGAVEPDGQSDDGRPLYAIANHAGLMRVAALWGRCGLVLGDGGMVGPTHREMAILEDCPLGKPRLPHEDPAWPLIDVGTVGFASEAELEAIVERSMDPAWRAGWSAAIGARARERFGMDRFARDVVELVRGSFR